MDTMRSKSAHIERRPSRPAGALVSDCSVVFLEALGRITSLDDAEWTLREPCWGSVRQRFAAGLRCSNASGCVAYPAIGEPATLSRGNPGPTCFACEERRVAAELEAARTAVRPEAKGRRMCAEQPCARPATERYGEASVCREHAAAMRAFSIWKRRRMWVLTCERALRSAIASGNDRLERKWARLLLEAEARSVWAEADLDAAEKRALHTSSGPGGYRRPGM